MIKLQIACLVILFFIGTIYFSGKRDSNYTQKVFSGLFIATGINIIFDIITVYTVNHLDKVNPIWNRAFHDFFIGSILLCLFLCFQYVYCLIKEEQNVDIHFPPIGYIPFVCSLIGLIFGELEYKETAKGNYASGSAAWMCYISVAIYVIISFFFMIRFWKQVNHKKRTIIIIALLIEVVCGVYQALYPTSLISGFGLVFIVFAAFMTMESPDVQLIELLKIEKKRADSANQAKSEFLASMSHEIRTPINAVIGMDEMILRESEEPEILEYAENIKSAAHSLLLIINDLLDFSKIESGKMEIVPVDYRLSSMLNDLISMIYFRVKDKDLALDIHISPQVPDQLCGDDVRIKQILTNILTNAVKYTNEGSITLRVDYEPVNSSEMNLKIAVTDTGIGIKEEDLAKLFESFQRLDEVKNRNVEGTGLGMSITKRLVTLMQGELCVESVYGKGSTFSVSIPQKVRAWDAVGDFKNNFEKSICKKEKYRSKFTAPEAKILIVDDNEMNCKVATGLLKVTQVQVTTVQSGKACIEKIRKEHFDLIFLDHMMPDMDGVETLHAMKARMDNQCADTPVICLTANAISGAKEHYLAEGFDDFLTKPIEGEAFEMMIRDYLPPEKVHGGAYQTRKPQTDLAIALKEIGLNYKEGIKRSGSEENLLDLLKIFVTTKDGKIEKLKQLLEKEDIANYRIEVHALKSAARVIGAMNLSEQAAHLEQCASDEKTQEIEELTPKLLAEYQSIGTAITPLVITEESNKQQVPEENLIKWFEELQEGLLVCDIDTVDSRLAQLQQSVLPEKVESLMPALADAVANLDGENGKKIIRSCLEAL